MKNEDKIIELLSEYLQKTDRVLDRLDKHDELFKNQLDVLFQHSKQIETLQKQTETLQKEALKRSIHQEELLKEIFSISKRVNNLEDQNPKS